MIVDDLLYQGVPSANWQMLSADRVALLGVLARTRPRRALEIGVYYGGSLSLIAEFCERVWAVDIDHEVPSRFAVPPNVDLRIGEPGRILADTLDELDTAGVNLNFVLIDADHSASGVRHDIETLIHRSRPPGEPMVVLMHDSGNPGCREGIRTASWAACPYVHQVELDFVAGQIVEHEVHGDRGEVWGGLALAYLHPTPRTGELVIGAGSTTTMAALHRCAGDLRLLR